MKTINSLIKHVRKFHKAGLRYVKLDNVSFNIVVYSDLWFAKNKDGAFPVVFLIFMADKTNVANLTEYARNNSRRVARPVLGAEKFDLADTCDSAILIQNSSSEALGKTLRIQVLTGTETLFNIIKSNSSTSEKIVMVDVEAAREAYKGKIIHYIIWKNEKIQSGGFHDESCYSSGIHSRYKNNQLHYDV